MLKSPVVLSCIVLLCLCNHTFANEKDQVKLQLKWNTQFQFAGYYAALEKGFYAEQNIDLTILQPNFIKSTADLVLDGEAEFGVADSSLVLSRLNNKKVVVLAAIFQHSPAMLLTKKADNIFGPFELAGKNVARRPVESDAAVTAMLEVEHVNLSNINEVYYTRDDLGLLSDNVDAMTVYSTDQPFLYHELGIATHLINPLNYGIDFYGDMLFTSETLLRENPDVAMRFKAASIKGWRYAFDHTEEVIDWLKNKYGAAKSIGHLRFEAKATKEMVLPDLVEIGSFNPDRFERIANIYIGQNSELEGRELTGIDYRFHTNSVISALWVKWIIIIAAVLAGLLVLFIFLSKRLRTLVNERTKALQRTKLDLQHYVDIVNKNIIISTVNIDNYIIDVSQAFLDISKYSRDELIGQHHSIIRHPDMAATIYEKMWETIHSGVSWKGELKCLAKDGSAFWVDVVMEPDHDEHGNVIGCTSIRHDISDKKRIEKLSETDHLTGLFNRAKIDTFFNLEMQKFHRYKQHVSVVMCDVDNFKTVNDMYGHQLGDNVLIEVARVLSSNIREVDIVGRWGGEEFMIICPSQDIEGAMALAEKLRMCIAASEFPELGKVTASFGVTTSKIDEDETRESIVKRADEALYIAKQLGRDRVIHC
ncbi:diguanylate cyclase [Paraglaciecola sp.]|uniref:diguanylate cyclase n=3 Tax=Paraglaciecola sp. TaxID=1920173 RepID=UPI00329710D5